jgi:hypothetical protein
LFALSSALSAADSQFKTPHRINFLKNFLPLFLANEKIIVCGLDVALIGICPK